MLLKITAETCQWIRRYCADRWTRSCAGEEILYVHKVQKSWPQSICRTFHKWWIHQIGVSVLWVGDLSIIGATNCIVEYFSPCQCIMESFINGAGCGCCLVYVEANGHAHLLQNTQDPMTIYSILYIYNILSIYYIYNIHVSTHLDK